MRHAIAMLAMFLCIGCTAQKTQVAQQAQPPTQLIGMTKAQIMSCMGSPNGLQQTSSGEVWSYPAGAPAGGQAANQAFTNALDSNGGTTPGNTGTGAYAGAGAPGAFGSANGGSHSCAVNIVFSSGKVSAINYLSQNGANLEGWECTNSVQNCAASPTP